MAVVNKSLKLAKFLNLLSPVSDELLTSKVSYNISSVNVARSITGKDFRDPDYKRPPPFPYQEKKFSLLQRFLDGGTSHRFDDNTKIIVVDGAIAAGKTAFAKVLAEDLDMLYLPAVTMDMKYINSYGYDMRQLDPKLPPSLKSFDEKNFCQDPKHRNVAMMQITLLMMKYAQYVDALAHLFNTGQGVILDKSVYSDYVFVEAMYKEGFISKSARSVYYDLTKHSIDELLKPHLAIYLDMPVARVQEKIKERNLPHEINSKALTPSFLTNLEEVYKRQYLKEISMDAELLIYDWSDGGDVEVVIEDIERIDFKKYTKYDRRLNDWRLSDEEAYNDYRKLFTDHKAHLMNLFNVPRFDCPELVIDAHDIKVYEEVWFNAPGTKYEEGYNEDMGDTGILTKLGSRKRKTSLFW